MKKVLIAGLFLALTNAAMASTEDELTSLSYISYLERYATILPANQDESLEAVINMPLVAGDRVDTAREARMEVVLADGNTLWMDEYTTLSFDAVAYSRDSEAERTVIFLAEGSIIVEVSEFALSPKPTRIDSRGATVYLDERGLYRLRALPTGGLRLEVLEGLAEAATTAGGVLIRGQTTAEVGGGEVQRTGLQFTWDDDFAAWVEMRRQVAAGESSQHVDLRYWGMAALPRRAVVLDIHRLCVDLLRALGMAALPLRLVVPRRRFRMGVVVGAALGSGLGELDVVARLCRMVPLRLLQLLVLELLRRVLPRVPSALPAGLSGRWRRPSRATQ